VPEKNPDSPATTSLAYDIMLPRWELLSDLVGGTDRMRAAADRYLPRHENESDMAYSERLSRAVLLNKTKQTLIGLVGEVFSEPVVVDEETPDAVVGWMDDIDLQGNNLHVFARGWFKDGLQKGFSAVMVDFPRTAAIGRRTRADDLREGVRPYWVHVPPENIIDMAVEIRAGREVVTHVRIREEEVRRVKFAQGTVNRIRSLTLVDSGSPVFAPEGWQAALSAGAATQAGEVFAFNDARVLAVVYEEDPKFKEDDPKRWPVVDAFWMEIGEIPLAVFYADRDGVLLSTPPLTDLAHLNVAHWQSSADQTNILTTARFPILASSGVVDEKKITVGPKNWLNIPDAAGRWYWVEHTGAAIESGRKDLQDLEEQMASYGAQFMKKKPAGTATERVLDEAGGVSDLEDTAMRFNDALAMAMFFTALWGRIEPDKVGSVSVSTDLAPDSGGPQGLAEVGQARRNGDLARGPYLAELQRFGALGPDFDAEENEEELEEERKEFLTNNPAGTDIDPGGGDDPANPAGGDPDDDAADPTAGAGVATGG
jgi:hypothetical protein